MDKSPSHHDGVQGLALNELKLSPYNPRWVEMYQNEARRLIAIPHALAVEHIGSTALSEIDAKPVVDITLMVDVPPEHHEITTVLTKLGYRSHGDYGLPGRQFFTLGEPPVFHLHVVARESPHWNDWLKFRDFLRLNPEWKTKYEIEKKQILLEAKGNRAHYTRLKGRFIKMILEMSEKFG